MQATERVILQRPFRTPMGRYDKSIEGRPTLVPVVVIKKYGLPKDAKIVGDDYIEPALREEEAIDPGLQAAEIEKEINERVEAELARRASEKRAEAAAGDAVEQGAFDPNAFLEQNIADIKLGMDELTKDELEATLDLEKKADRPRRGVVTVLEATIDDLTIG